MSKIICIYDRIKNMPVEVEVSDEVYTQYMRTGWRIKNNNRSFYKHEIQFSSLKGTCNYYNEFISETDWVESKIYYRDIYECIDKLSSKERAVINLIFFEGYSESECAKRLGTYQQKISRIKRRALAKLYELIKNS